MGGDISRLFIFLIIKHNNKLHESVPKMKNGLKVASACCIKTYEHFKFQI